jgi:hypothetical protein
MAAEVIEETPFELASSGSRWWIMYLPHRLTGICCMPKALKNKKKRRDTNTLDVTYSDDPNDLGNLHD